MTLKGMIETTSFMVSKLWDKVSIKIKISKSLEEFNVRIRVGFTKTILARSVNCTLNIFATSKYERFFMFRFTLFACFFFSNNADTVFLENCDHGGK